MLPWHAVPFLRFLLPMILGIFLGIYTPIPIVVYILAIVLPVLGYLFLEFKLSDYLSFKYTHLKGTFIVIFFCGLGGYNVYVTDFHKRPNFFAKEKFEFLEVHIEEPFKKSKKSYRTIGSVKRAYTNNGISKNVSGNVMLYFQADTISKLPEIYATIIIKNHVKPIKGASNPGEFNYKQYLSYKNIFHQQYLPEGEWHKIKPPTRTIYYYSNYFRNIIINLVGEHITRERERGIAEALLVGNKTSLNKEITESYSRTGTLHVLAVSGLHAGIIFMLLSFASSFLKKTKQGERIHFIIIIAGIWFYAFVTGLSPSVLRASLMFTIVTIGKLTKNKGNVFNSLFLSAFVLLLYNPYYIVDVGFQLSYSAVIGIVLFQPHLRYLLVPPNKPLLYLWDLSCVSFAAQLGTFPISLFYFHQFPNYFILSNLLVIPLTMLILVGLVILVIIHFIPVVSTLFATAIVWLLKLNIGIIEWMDKLPFSAITGIHISFWEAIAIYAAIGALYILFTETPRGSLLASFVILTLLFASVSYRSIQNRRQNMIVFHSINKDLVISLVNGKSCVLYADSAFLHDEDKIKFFLNPFFFEHGLNDLQKVAFSSEFENNYVKIKHGFVSFNGKMLLVQEFLKTKTEINIPIDYLLYRKNKYDAPKVREYNTKTHGNPHSITTDKSNYKEWDLIQNGARIITLKE